MFGEGFGASEEFGAVFAFQRRAIKTTANFEFDAAANGFQRVESLFQSAHIAEPPGTKIEIDFGGVRNDVRARAAIDEVRVDGHAVTGVVPFFNACDLSGEFMNGVDTLIGVQTGVGRAAMDHELGFPNALTRSLDQPARAEARLKDEDGVASAGFFFNELARGFAANFLVGGPEEDEPLGNGGFQFLQGFESKEGLNDTSFHVKGAGAESLSANDAEGHFGKSAGRIDRIVMAEDKELRTRRSRQGGPDGAEMIAAMSLLDDLDESSAEQPFVSEKASAAVCVVFFETGGFDEGELAQSVHHPREPFTKVSMESFGKCLLSHDEEMVAMQSAPGNSAALRG